MPLTLAVVHGSFRRDRQGIKLARFLVNQLGERGHAAPLLDAMAHPLPMLDRMYKEYPQGQAPAVLEELATVIRGADGFVIVAGEYNHGVQPGLANLLDHFLEEWFWRPSAIACYSAGAFGGVRAAMALRATLCELGMPSVPSLFPVPKIGQAFDDDGTPTDDAWPRRAKRFLDEFTWYAEALKAARAGGTPY
jgi:NAD(P)H-dependent FMN reductase